MSANLPVVYLDNHLLVVRKPAGLLSQADETGDADVVSLGRAFLKEKFDKPGKVFLGLVHRLDRPASGIMVLARTSKAAARLSDSFRRRQVRKHYLALVDGSLEGSGVWRDHLVKQDKIVRRVSEDFPGAKEAILAWFSLAAQPRTSLIDVDLTTGRPHQIRIQFAERGHPLVGDFRYGSERTFDGRNLGLHCYRLSLEHPVRREPMDWIFPPPDSWRPWFAGEWAAHLKTLTGKTPDPHGEKRCFSP